MGTGTESTTTRAVDSASTTAPLDTTASDAEADTGTTTGPPPMCDEPDGAYSAVCPVDAPFCVGQACTPCSNDDPLTDCGSAQGAPGAVCSAGACVECTSEDSSACGGTTPICDAETSACAACTAHDQCPGGAGCHLFEGSCLPSDTVFMVNAAAPMCGEAGQPYCDISSALDAAGVATQATIRVAPQVYVEPVIITTDAVVAIIGDGNVTIVGNGGSPGVTVNVNGTGYLARVVVENGSAAPGVQSAGDLRLDGVRIRDANDGLVSLQGRVHLENVRVSGNDVTGISVGGTEQVTLRNVIIASNGVGTNPRGFVATANTPFSMVYTTITDNSGTNGGAIACAGDATRSVRNSIVVSSNFVNAIECGGLTVTHSVVSDADHEGEATNVLVVDDTGLMFGMGFEIEAGSVAEGVAVWMAGDPLFDINGVMRPAVDGSPDAAGANIPD